MPKLPPVSGREIIRALERIGFREISQRGSHVKLRRGDALCIVPLHQEIRKGTLAGVLRQAKLSADEFINALKQ